MNMVVLKDLAKGKMVFAAGPEVERAYAYLPDMARAAVALAEMRAQLPRFADVPFAGLNFTLSALHREVERQTGRPVKVTGFAWWMMALAAPFWELARELREMRYLFDTSHALDAAPLAALLPDFAITPFAEVVRRHVQKLTSTQTGR